MVCSQTVQIWVIFTRLKLWVALPTHNFKGGGGDNLNMIAKRVNVFFIIVIFCSFGNNYNMHPPIREVIVLSEFASFWGLP